MTDPRTPIFDAIRAAKPDGKLQAGDVDAIHGLLDGLGVPRAPATAPAGGVSGAGASATAGAVTAPSTHRATSQRGIDLIHSFEQCRLTAYPDPGSADGKPWTIGWGSTGPGIARGTVWTQQQADDRFKSDLAKFELGVIDAIGSAATTQAQFDALVSLAYNIGINAMAGSTVVRRHKAGDYQGAAAAFGMWVKNDGKTMKGLVRRRAAEADLYRGLA